MRIDFNKLTTQGFHVEETEEGVFEVLNSGPVSNNLHERIAGCLMEFGLTRKQVEHKTHRIIQDILEEQIILAIKGEFMG